MFRFFMLFLANNRVIAVVVRQFRKS